MKGADKINFKDTKKAPMTKYEFLYKKEVVIRNFYY